MRDKVSVAEMKGVGDVIGLKVGKGGMFRVHGERLGRISERDRVG